MTSRHHPTVHRYVVLIAGVALAALTLILHGSALQGFWRFDDPLVLNYVVAYPDVAGYFFVPEQWQALGVPFFTPWLVLEYWLDLALFGLNPSMFYAHLLVTLWLAALLTFVLLRRYAGSLFAGIAAMLFLMGAPVTVLAQQIMARHYVTGLVFTILAIFFWLRAHETCDWKFQLMASGCYLMAILNKEIFAPLPLVLFFLMNGSLWFRLRALMPLAFTAAFFLFWRASMLGRVIGGYHDGLYGVDHIRHSLVVLPEVLFGSGWTAWVAVAATLLAVWVMLRFSRQSGFVLGAAIIALLLPFVAVSVSVDPINLRFAFLFWWGICVVTALGFSRLGRFNQQVGCTFSARRSGYLLFFPVLIIATAAFMKGRETADAYDNIVIPFDVQGRFIWEHDQTTGYIPFEQVAKSSLSYTHPLSLLKLRFSRKEAPFPFPFLGAAVKFSPRLTLYIYDVRCRCMKEQVRNNLDVDDFYPSLLLGVYLDRISSGLTWVFQSPMGSECFLLFQDIRASFTVPCGSGKVNFDLAPWVKGKFRFIARTQDQRWNASPIMIFPEKGGQVEWSSYP